MPQSPRSKSERRQLRKEQQQQSRARAAQRARLRWAALIGVGLVAVAAVVLLQMRPRPGEAVPDLGRQHIPDGVPVQYNSNPPTSGPHYGTPAGTGIYERPIPDGNLVHSLEHGYIVISYNCEAVAGTDCEQLTGQLARTARANRLWKLIVVPRPQLEVPVALTAWRRVEHLEQGFDQQRISEFIRHWRDKGPERTEM